MYLAIEELDEPCLQYCGFKKEETMTVFFPGKTTVIMFEPHRKLP